MNSNSEDSGDPFEAAVDVAVVDVVGSVDAIST